MHYRSGLLLVSSLSLIACSFDTPTSTGSSSARQTSGKESGSKAGGRGDIDEKGDDGAPPTGTSAIDGTWDISAAGPDAIGPSEMTIQGNHVTGTIVNGDEGTVYSETCSLAKSRMTFDVTVTGDRLTAKFTQQRTYTGSCADDTFRRDGKLEATRTHDAKNANGATVVEGQWQILAEDTPKAAVSVTGLVAKAWDNAKKSGVPVLTSNVDGSRATTTTDFDTLAFAARKR